jgi:hypothetical protein
MLFGHQKLQLPTAAVATHSVALTAFNVTLDPTTLLEIAPAVAVTLLPIRMVSPVDAVTVMVCAVWT